MNKICLWGKCINLFRQINSYLILFLPLVLASCLTPIPLEERLRSQHGIIRVSEYKLGDKSYKLVVTGGRFSGKVG